MDSVKKKEIVSEYKQRKVTGGVYKITNSGSGRYMIKGEVDLQSFQNRFDFMQKTKVCINPKMQKDFNEFGPESFSLEFLEGVEQKEEESRMGFKDRLKRLEEVWKDKFDPEKSY